MKDNEAEREELRELKLFRILVGVCYLGLLVLAVLLDMEVI